MATQVSKDFRSGFWLWLVVASGVMIASGLLYHALRSSAPRYKGRTSAQWFREFQRAATRHWTIPVLILRASGSGRALDFQALLREPAATGLRALGNERRRLPGPPVCAARMGCSLAPTGNCTFDCQFRLKGFLPKPPVAAELSSDGDRLGVRGPWARCIGGGSITHHCFAER